MTTTSQAAGTSGLIAQIAQNAQKTATAASSSSTSTIDANFNLFLTLLTTQLKNQNPTDPTNTDQLTQQITSETAVEQQIKSNDLLQKILNGQTANASSTALGYLNNNATVKGSAAQLSKGSATWSLNASAASTGTVTITDQSGNTVFSTSLNLTSGTQPFVWNGQTSSGTTAPDGVYHIAVTATAADGTAATVTTAGQGRVTSVDFSGSTPVLTVAGQQVKLSDVLAVSAPSS